MAYVGYSNPLPRCINSRWAIIAGAQYAKINQNGICKIVSTSRLTSLAKEEISNVEVTYDSKTNANTSPVKEASIELEKNSYAVETFSATTTDLAGHSMLFDRTTTIDRITRSTPPSMVSSNCQEVY